MIDQFFYKFIICITVEADAVPVFLVEMSNLIEIYAAVTGKSPEAVEQEFSGQGYGAFKPAVGEAVVEALRPIREETQRLLADKAYLESLYRQGAEKAAAMANRTLRKVHKKVGFVPR